MSAPLVGRRVVLEGIVSKPEWNGQLGLALSFDDAKGRYNVKLDQGELTSLKPANLRAAPEAQGMPGFSGMPGMGGIPGMAGMPGMGNGLGSVAVILSRLVQQLRAASPQHASMAVMGLIMLLRMLGVNLFSLPVLLLVKRFGTFIGGRFALQSMLAYSCTMQRMLVLSLKSLHPSQAFVLIAGVAYISFRYLYNADGSSIEHMPTAGKQYAAYTKGFNDGKSNNTFDPISDANDTKAGSGFGIGKIFNLLIVMGLLYQLGGGGSVPWNLNNVIANARNMNPLNLIVIMNMLSGLIW
ncbi:MAG: hypothetical protein SGPRY_010162 [Prymnesium sp.]